MSASTLRSGQKNRELGRKTKRGMLRAIESPAYPWLRQRRSVAVSLTRLTSCERIENNSKQTPVRFKVLIASERTLGTICLAPCTGLRTTDVT